MYLVEVGSGKILWSFSSGPSIYSSYQQIPNLEGEKLNASTDADNFYIDCGEDWELYVHGTGVKAVVEFKSTFAKTSYFYFFWVFSFPHILKNLIFHCRSSH